MKVAGHWRYLYRAIDRNGNLLDSMLSEHRDRAAARRFLGQLLELNGRRPLRVTTDRHPAYEKAIRWNVGRKATHRQKRYLNNRTEQDHRGIKQRYYPMLASGTLPRPHASVWPSTPCATPSARGCNAATTCRWVPSVNSLPSDGGCWPRRWPARSPAGLAQSCVLGAAGRATPQIVLRPDRTPLHTTDR